MPEDKRKLFVVFLTMGLVLLISVAAVYFIGARILTANQSVLRHQMLTQDLDDTLSTLKDLETGQRGYLLTGDEAYLEPYHDGKVRIDSDLKHLDDAVGRGDLPREKVDRIKDMVAEKLRIIDRSIEQEKAAGRGAGVAVMQRGNGKRVMNILRDEIGALTRHEIDDIAAERDLVRRGTMIRTGIFIACGLLNLAFILWAFHRTTREIDRRDAAAEEVRRQREVYATTLASIGDAVITTDAHGRITFINKVARDLTGWQGDESIGHPLAEVFRIINESTRLPVESPVEKVLRLGTVVGLANHTLLIRKDGTELPIDDSGAPIRQIDGSIRGVVLVFRDFSEYKRHEAVVRQSEERLRLAVDAAELGTFYCQFPLGKIQWNDKCKSHFWLPPDVQVDIDLFYSILHPEDRDRVRQAIERAQNDRGMYDTEYRTVSPGGATRWVRAIGRFFFNDQGKPTRFDGITIDISDRKRQEQELRDTQMRAETANKAKDQFLATLSHELRTPLTPVLATLSMWDQNESDLPPQVRAEVQMLRRNVELEARLIDDLLDLTRVVRGKLVLSPETVNVHQLLENVVGMCCEESKSKKIDVQLQLRADEPKLRADSARLHQVFSNILRNAVKFSPRQGSVQVRTSDDNGQLRVSITDHGIGLTQETMEKLFLPFEQGGEEITRRFGGLGLGLAISKALVDAHGGEVSAQSDGAGHGATFTVVLPRGSDGHALDDAPVAEADPVSPAPLRRVLVVEDHADTARILQLVMRHWGHETEIADSVAAAVELAKARPFDLIVSDIGLPDGTGLDLIRQVRVFSQVPAIALTGFGMDEDIANTRAAGFNAHLIKPTNLQELEALLNKLTAL